MVNLGCSDSPNIFSGNAFLMDANARLFELMRPQILHPSQFADVASAKAQPVRFQELVRQSYRLALNKV
jgi:hypothetical protein